MAPENIILKLRPASGKAADIATALALATTAAADQEAAIATAKADRDDALLDAEPAVLRKAEQVLADAREQAERINAVLANLQQRHTAAMEAEMLGNIEDLKQQHAAAYDAVNAWWMKEREDLAKRFAKGVALSRAVTSTFYAMDQAQRRAQQVYPGKSARSFTPPPMQASDWARELGDKLKWLHDSPGDVATIATLCDPKPPGTF